MSITLLLLIGLASASAGVSSPQARPDSTATSGTTRPAATAKSSSDLTLAESDRLYAHRTEEAAQQYAQAVRAAQKQRLRQLRTLKDHALTAKDLDAAIHIQDLITSTEAQLKAAPPGHRKPITLHVTGKIDGKGVLVIRQDRAAWQQQQYGYPEGLTINGVRWEPGQVSTLDNRGATTYLPGKVNFRTAALVKKSGRSPVEVLAGADELHIAVDDADPGAGRYDLVIELAPAAPDAAAP
jgi:hypothetical protein